MTVHREHEGYGFVSTADLVRDDTEGDFQTTDVFFHVTELETNTVSEGDRLASDIVETDDGP